MFPVRCYLTHWLYPLVRLPMWYPNSILPYEYSHIL
jgi:hypothetical protein